VLNHSRQSKASNKATLLLLPTLLCGAEKLDFSKTTKQKNSDRLDEIFEVSCGVYPMPKINQKEED
jgi:hypothetical protein